MKDYRRGAHTTFEIHLPLVWVTKYRKPVMTGEVGLRLRELLREICGNQEVTMRWSNFAGHDPLAKIE